MVSEVGGIELEEPRPWLMMSGHSQLEGTQTLQSQPSPKERMSAPIFIAKRTLNVRSDAPADRIIQMSHELSIVDIHPNFA